ncbi:Metallo-dependent phosphatase-like protein [Coemansia spiralis]|nr:Metallo-dependent phosphatase-like protein [Coemansia spiralis]
MAATNEADVLTILVATDNHLGYMERDPIRGDDSYHAFSEILQLAKSRCADMVLLGGDLFHENKPSRKCMHQALSLLRQHCMGDTPVSVEYLSDPQVDFAEQAVNYEDPNMNISLPVFSIHGNHDDPSGDGNLSAMDLLAVSGLVNYFGRQAQVEDIRVAPVLLRKGDTRLALYGLGNVRDERLHRTMARKRLTMCQPAEDTSKWFNLLVLHQNRVPHGLKNHIPEGFLSDFLDLVVWGHEHQCQVDPEYNHQKSFYVTQPGSSVATAMSMGEAVPKHVALLRINKRSFKIDKIRLKNVRPFVIEDVVLAQASGLSPQSTENEIIDYLKRKAEAMLVRAQKQYGEQLKQGDEGVEPLLGTQPKPLVRIRVEYSGGFESFHPQRFGLLFADRVANPRDILYFYRKQAARTNSSTSSTTQDNRPSVPMPMDAVHVENLIGEFLDDASMQMLVDLELAEAIRQFVQKGENDAIAHALKQSIDMTQKQILSQKGCVDESALAAKIAGAREIRRQRAVENGQGLTDTARDDVVMLSSRRSNINATDRKAIMAFERAAKTSHSADTRSESEQSDNGFRVSGVARRRRVGMTGAAPKPVPPLSGASPGKENVQATTDAEKASNAEESDAEQPMSDTSIQTRPSTTTSVSRPSRNARSTLARRGKQIPAESSKTVAPEAVDETTDDEASIESSIPAAKRQKTVAAGAATKRGRGRGASKRGSARKADGSQRSSTTGSSQMPVVDINDDDDGEEQQSGRGRFGRFSLRKRN